MADTTTLDGPTYAALQALVVTIGAIDEPIPVHAADLAVLLAAYAARDALAAALRRAREALEHTHMERVPCPSELWDADIADRYEPVDHDPSNPECVALAELHTLEALTPDPTRRTAQGDAQ